MRECVQLTFPKMKRFNLCLTLALTFYPLPRGEEMMAGRFGFADARPANPVA